MALNGEYKMENMEEEVRRKYTMRRITVRALLRPYFLFSVTNYTTLYSKVPAVSGKQYI